MRANFSPHFPQAEFPPDGGIRGRLSLKFMAAINGVLPSFSAAVALARVSGKQANGWEIHTLCCNKERSPITPRLYPIKANAFVNSS